MTMQPPNQESENPRIVLMATDAALATDTVNSEPTSWSVGNSHPYHKTMRVIAMYLRGDVIEIYSFDGNNGIREIVPKSRVRLIREEMPPEIFRDELAHAEAGYPDDDIDDDVDDDPEPPPGDAEQPPVAATPPNGQS